MPLTMKMAFGCFAIVALMEAAFGTVYYLSPTIMPYHLEIVGTSWEEIPEGARTMLLALLGGMGACMISFAVGITVVLVGPLRKGATWAPWVLAGFMVPGMGLTTHGVVKLRLTTGASVPLGTTIFFDCLLLAGIVLAVLSNKRAAAS